MLMDLQEAGAQSARAARVGSMHSLNMDPAVNCYASSLNPDGSLAAETLAATFARVMMKNWRKFRQTNVFHYIHMFEAMRMETLSSISKQKYWDSILKSYNLILMYIFPSSRLCILLGKKTGHCW